jgi:hypothetical protein
MKMFRVAAAIALAAFLSACQTVGGGPSLTAAQRLAAASFTSQSIESFNRDLQPGDIRTTALYACENEARCAGLALIAYGLDPDAASRQEFEEAARQPRPLQLRTLRTAFRGSGIRDLSFTNLSTLRRTNGEVAYRIDASARIAGERFGMRLIVIYGTGPGRVYAVIAQRGSDALQRLGGIDMLE